jgi:aminoglycoside phosphotransferase (APT) family kinase protein
MTSDKATPDIAASLLAYLRTTTGAQELAYADPPQQIVGGYDTRIFAFQLANAPASFSGPLILRLFAEDDDPLRARWEGAVQTAVAGLGYPAPRVLDANNGTDILGAAFLIMKRLPGRPMLQAATFAAMLPQAVRLLTAYPQVLAQYQARLHALDPCPLLRAIEAEELPAAGPIESGIGRRSATLDGQLEQLARHIERLSLDKFRPALSWLLDNRPSDPLRPVICHGDFHPINILMEDGVVTGVIDWSMTTAAEAAFDVGNTRLLLAIAPMELPAVVDSIVAPMRRVLVRRYSRAYQILRPVDAEHVRYFEALRCLMELSWVADRRATGAGMYRNPWGSTRSIGKLVSHFQKVTGVAPAL